LLLDTLIIAGGMLVIGLIMGVMAFSSGMSNVIDGLLLVISFVVSWGYFTFFESGKRGATIGKRTVGLRVIDRSGNNITRGQAFIRNVLRFVDMLPGIPTTAAGFLIGSFGLGFFCCLFTRKFQRVGDLVRAGMWSEARRIELSDHVSELTQKKGMAGMSKLLGMAKWIKEKR